MTKDDITRIARQAGFVGFDGETKCLRDFALLVAATEREACAKIADMRASTRSEPDLSAEAIAWAIRRRGAA